MSNHCIDDSNVGTVLSDARREAGMTIADVAAATKVSTRYLTAIEREEFHHLPSRIHILGFTRAFAKAVNVEERAVVSAIKDRLEDRLSPGAERRPSHEASSRGSRGFVIWRAAKSVLPI